MVRSRSVGTSHESRVRTYRVGLLGKQVDRLPGRPVDLHGCMRIEVTPLGVIGIRACRERVTTRCNWGWISVNRYRRKVLVRGCAAGPGGTIESWSI